MHRTKQRVRELVGKDIFAVKKDGTMVRGKLVKIKGSELIVKPSGDKKVSTKAILPLVLYDLLAIGYYGGYGGGYGYPGYGYNHPYGFPPGYGHGEYF